MGRIKQANPTRHNDTNSKNNPLSSTTTTTRSEDAGTVELLGRYCTQEEGEEEVEDDDDEGVERELEEKIKNVPLQQTKTDNEKKRPRSATWTTTSTTSESKSKSKHQQPNDGLFATTAKECSSFSTGIIRRRPEIQCYAATTTTHSKDYCCCSCCCTNKDAKVVEVAVDSAAFVAAAAATVMDTASASPTTAAAAAAAPRGVVVWNPQYQHPPPPPIHHPTAAATPPPPIYKSPKQEEQQRNHSTSTTFRTDGGEDGPTLDGCVLWLANLALPNYSLHILLQNDDDDDDTNSRRMEASEHSLPHQHDNICPHCCSTCALSSSTSTGGDGAVSSSSFPIVTHQGAMEVWSLAFFRNDARNDDGPTRNQPPDAKKKNHYKNDNGDEGTEPTMEAVLRAVGQSVQSGVLCLQLNVVGRGGQPSTATTSRLYLRIGLRRSMALLECCNRENLPLSSSSRSTALLRRRRAAGGRTASTAADPPAEDIHWILSCLYPQSEIFDWAMTSRLCTSMTHKNKTAPLRQQQVTAKQVYSLLDNVQLLSALERRRDTPTSAVSPRRTITGLLPTLRPYQAEAVEWMIRRESTAEAIGISAVKENGKALSALDNCTNDDDNNEWELAWVVLMGENAGSVSPLQPSCISLPEWMKKNFRAKRREVAQGSELNALLFSPFTGWLATSLEQAQTMTLGPMDNLETGRLSIKGGILAESMGLGKTVEVLACILANPYNLPPRSALDASAPTFQRLIEVGRTVKRHLDFEKCDKTCDGSIGNAGGIGVVGDMHQFCDDDDEEELVQIEPTLVTISSTCLPSCTSNVAKIVTPVKENRIIEVEERWTDEDILGACICGDLIGFFSHNGPGLVTICSSCDEPMHMHCAAFSSAEELRTETIGRRYRHRFSNKSLDCRVCHPDRCPCCVALKKSGATLIVTPPAILDQWEREIHRHARQPNGQNLRVVVYDGIKRLSQTKSSSKGRSTSAIKCMHPAFLAETDIVLMTFDALMSDLGHTDDNSYVTRGGAKTPGGNLRKRKKYRVVPSPLLSILWWRVCLDEAQRVETPTAGSAQMALKLESHNRWCISGTPVGRGKLEDLYGLLLFLRLDPFWDKQWFRKCFNPAFRNVDGRIQHLLRNVAWRSTKTLDLVRDQMGVPEQIEKKIVLQFSSIEKHFYERQLEQTLSVAGDVADREQKNAKRKSSSHFHRLSDHLHKLRAACCHPQVGSSGIGTLRKSRSTNDGDSSVSSRVLTMGQILDKLVDDAKTQCEESLRLAILHTNGMAAISKLQVEAKQRGVAITSTESELLNQSCGLYDQAIRLADENAVPTLIMGESTLSGSSGFRSHRKMSQRCSFRIDWSLPSASPVNDIWSKFDFSFGPSRKITQLLVRARSDIPLDIEDLEQNVKQWHILLPKKLSFQCQSASGDFVEVHTFTIPLCSAQKNDWLAESGFRTNKSKSWRLVVHSFHGRDASGQDNISSMNSTTNCSYIGMDVEFFEATVASDPLQRLHCLHNSSRALSSLLQLQETAAHTDNDRDSSDRYCDTRKKLESLSSESTKIETLYLDYAIAIHSEHRRRLAESLKARKDLEFDLVRLSREAKQSGDNFDCWDDKWWDDFLVICHLYGSDTQQNTIRDKMLQDLDGLLRGGVDSVERVGLVPFPMFEDITGLRLALQMRISDIRLGLGSKVSRRGQKSQLIKNTAVFSPREGRFKCGPGSHDACMQSILDLSNTPTEEEMLENSRCKICKADWLQTGPMCRHCKIGEELEDLAPDKVTLLILSSIHSLLKSSTGASLMKLSNTKPLLERAKTFFNLMEASKKERTTAWRLWRTHSDLLNDLDELNQCKRAVRLTLEGEDLTALTQDEQNAVVAPIDTMVRYHDHAAKQAMALGALSRAKGTLQYLKNQNASEHRTVAEGLEKKGSTEKETCAVCLSTFDSDRAVLRCGHSFHLTPCLEQLRSRSGGSHIRCPLRCPVRTEPKDVLIASDGKRHDDGSQGERPILGSYGTKVTRLVSDILDVCERGEKSLVFSQWDDMLVICEQALAENNVPFVRVSSLKHISDCTRRFRQLDCAVMLLNVKNGAEGLTLVEATHVFMIEPLLNCGLDSQGKKCYGFLIAYGICSFLLTLVSFSNFSH